MSEKDLVRISRELAKSVSTLKFSLPVTHVYNPLIYAARSHEAYLTRYGTGPKKYILMGMNPGPWGMAQTGVPFGDIETVGQWLKIDEALTPPDRQHPKRPILGLNCSRVEVSGTRLWSWARDIFTTPEEFFADFFIINYCPLVFMEESGRNRTPDKLNKEERNALIRICDDALLKTVETLQPSWLIGVGRFARLRAEQALSGVNLKIGEILHPSPASPAANRGWRERITAQLEEMGIQ